MQRWILTLMLVSTTAMAQTAGTTGTTQTRAATTTGAAGTSGTTATAGTTDTTAASGTSGTAGSKSTNAPAPSQSDYKITTTLVPKSVFTGGEAMLHITVEAAAGKLDGASIEVTAYGYDVAPVTSPIVPAENATQRTWDFTIRHAGVFASRQGTAVIRVLRGEQQLAVKTFEFGFDPILNCWTYLGLGLLGVLIGYLVRLALKIAKEQAQADATAALKRAESPKDGAPQPTRFDKWVAKHFYLFDCVVTLIIGGLVLISLMQDGRPPATTGFWHNALTTGVGLGFLTNSDLITRFKA